MSPAEEVALRSVQGQGEVGGGQQVALLLLDTELLPPRLPVACVHQGIHVFG